MDDDKANAPLPDEDLRFLSHYWRLMGEKYFAPGGDGAQHKWISHKRETRWGRLTRSRKAFTAIAAFGAIGCASGSGAVHDFRSPTTLMWVVGTGTVVASIALLVCVAAEIVLGAGIRAENQLKRDTGIVQEYMFIPSLNQPVALLALIVIAYAGCVAGFAFMCTLLSAIDPAAFSRPLTGRLSSYFVSQTILSLGSGDILPQTQVARDVTVLQGITSRAIDLLSLSAAIAWIVSQANRVRRRMETADGSGSALRERIVLKVDSDSRDPKVVWEMLEEAARRSRKEQADNEPK